MKSFLSRSTLAMSAVLVGAGLFLAGCGGGDSHGHAGESKHAHTAPHGGTLMEVGEHAYNLEFLLDRSEGKLTAYLLDGHAENFIRSDQPALNVSVATGGTERALVLAPVASSITGETVGNTSQFEASADWLKGAGPVTVKVASFAVRGTTFTALEAALPAK